MLVNGVPRCAAKKTNIVLSLRRVAELAPRTLPYTEDCRALLDQAKGRNSYGTGLNAARCLCGSYGPIGPHLMHWRSPMNGIIYLVGLVVVVMAVLSLIGIH